MELEFRQLKDNPKYWVTNTGEIFNENFARTGLGGFLKKQLGKRGYYTVTLKVNGSSKKVAIHRLVTEGFLGESNLHVNHIDGNKQNNNIENLQYVTAKENIIHAYDTELNKRTGHIKKYGNRYMSHIRIKGARYYKYFSTEKDAEFYILLLKRRAKRCMINWKKEN